MLRRFDLIVLCLALAATSGCFVRHRAVISPAARQASPMAAATREELVDRLHAFSDPIRSFVMRADLSPSILNPAKGEATDYASVSVYVLFRRPDDLRVLGRDPVLGATIFDMVSNGEQFRMSIPSKSRFFIGSATAPGTSQNKLENLRPDALLSSLIIDPPNPETDLAFLEQDTERGVYILMIVRRAANSVTLARQVYFDGRSLQITRQKNFDLLGSIVGDTRYSDWKNYGSITYPSGIDIQRPKDNYEVQFSVTSMNFNSADITPRKFVLEQPPGSQLEVLR